MVTWTQMYMPMGGLGLSALVALIPIIFFFVALAVLRLKGHVAGAITLILSILIAIFAFKMPIDMAFAAAGYGFIYGLWPIAWIIVAAVFLYKLTVASGQFDIIRSSVISITDDQRLQVLLIGFSFGALLEGAAGFGARWRLPVRCWWAGLQTVIRGGAVSDCQHCAGGVWCVGRADSGRRSGNGNRSVPHWRNGGTSVTVPVGSCAVLAGSNDGRLERGERDVASGAGCWGSFAVTQFFTSNYIGRNCRILLRRW